LPGLRLGKRHFNALDLSRLLAACAVLFWHYQHFFVPPVSYQFHVDRSVVSPFYHQLAWLFDYGHVAVQYFWAVSGFVFAHVYLADAGARGRFWLARVARLWPLHLLTLVLVALMQAAYNGINGTEFIYHQQSVKHFLLSLGLAHYWGWQGDQSFNGPSWSLSTEILAYAAFWVLLPGLRRAPLVLALAAAMLALGLFFGGFPNKPVFTCIGYFFGGAAVYGAALRWPQGWADSPCGWVWCAIQAMRRHWRVRSPHCWRCWQSTQPTARIGSAQRAIWATRPTASTCGISRCNWRWCC